MAQIGLDFEVGIEREGRIAAVLELAAELAMQRGVRQIGDVRAHARDREPALRIGSFDEIAAVPPFRIGHDGLAADLMEGDVLRRMPRRRCDRQCREHAGRIARRPLQHLHAAHRPAGNREQRLDTEIVEQHGLRAHHVADGDDGKIEAPRAAGFGIDGGRAGGAHAGPNHVGTDDEVALGVDRPPRAHHGLPPARLGGDGMRVGHVLIAGQRMTDQHRVRAPGIESPVGLIGDLERLEVDAGIERKRPVRAKAHNRRPRVFRLAHARGEVPRHDLSFDHPAPAPAGLTRRPHKSMAAAGLRIA
jgi:hypothetical protein